MTSPHEKISEIVDAAVVPFAHRKREKAGGDGELCADGISAPNSPARPAEDEPRGPRALGFSVENLNCEYALVLLGSKAVVFRERSDAPIEERKRILSLEAFDNWFANRFTEIIDRQTSKIKSVTWAKAWRQHKDRRQFSGVEFYPDPDNELGTPDYLNLWSGFAVKPATEPDPTRYKIFRDHLLTNVCRGDESRFRWVFGFFAHVMQKPREKPGTALVLRGGQGWGKTIVGEVFGSLIPQHHSLVSSPRYVTGQFNIHMATCLLLQADEAVWAGDKTAEGALKALITTDHHYVEAKGIDPIKLPNYVRLIMTSNEDWVVPAAKDERRFGVFDIDPRCAKDHNYFREMREELDDGGREHLLADLLAFDLSSINLRLLPDTEALFEQKIRSLKSVESWWYGRLMSGLTTEKDDGWREKIPTELLFNDYIATAEKIGEKRKREETVFGIDLRKLLPDEDDGRGGKTKHLDKTRESGWVYRDGAQIEKRVPHYKLPPLKKARELFERAVGQYAPWPADDVPDAHLGREREI